MTLFQYAINFQNILICPDSYFSPQLLHMSVLFHLIAIHSSFLYLLQWVVYNSSKASNVFLGSAKPYGDQDLCKGNFIKNHTLKVNKVC